MISITREELQYDIESIVLRVVSQAMPGIVASAVTQGFRQEKRSLMTMINDDLVATNDRIDNTSRKILKKLDTKINDLDVKLTTKIDSLDKKLSAKIDSVDIRLSQRIDNVEKNLTHQINSLNTGQRHTHALLQAHIPSPHAHHKV